VPTVAESANALSQGSSDVAALQLLSLDQEIAFTQYTRYVLPLDGYVFWLRTGATNVKGSLHVSIAKQQNEDETLAINKVIFSTGTAIQKFNDIDSNKIWVGSYHDIRFAFTRSDAHYKSAGIFHYVGDAVYPALANMLVDTGDQLPLSTLVVSNSLPLWLSLVSYEPVWLNPPNPAITLYPSFLVPDNLRPPYGVVHIPAEATRALSASPRLGPFRPVGNAALGTINGTTSDSTHWQLVADRVKITLYGTTNQQALDFQDLVNRFSIDQDSLGMMNTPVMVDEKRTQAELGILAMKKSITYEVSYYQSRANAAAQKLIEHASVTLYQQPLF
jgi:hypothetical protein